jgi:hypothetical protein
VRRAVAFLASACLGTASACAVPRQMLAPPDDLADYRAFRSAGNEGTRLGRAQAYLARHPEGVWAGEVRVAFDTEESAWFEAAKTSRARALDYVVDLPTGPHAEAARALLIYFDQRKDDIDTLELLAKARRTEATLEVAARERKRVGEVVLEELGALLDPSTWGSRASEPPPVLAAVLRGASRRTWGGGTDDARDDALSFTVPTAEGAQSRDVVVQLRILVRDGRVSGGVVQGDRLLLRWAEAMTLRVLDPSVESDREAVRASVREVLSGAFEAILPAARCDHPATAPMVVSRVCDGWSATVVEGKDPGDPDVILVQGPARN